MSYEINVSLNGRHFFATHKRSLTTQKEAIAAYKILKQKFPESEGYQLSISNDPGISYGCYFDKTGNFVDGYYDREKLMFTIPNINRQRVK